MMQKIKENPKIGLCLFLFLLVIGSCLAFLKNSFAVVEPIKSVTITSKNVSYEKKEPGSWNVEKSAKWIEKGKAQITFDLDTVVKTEKTNTDIILVLDVSGSMDGEKLTRVKEDATDLVDTLLSNNQNQAALISFESESKIIENLTTDKDKMIEQINNLTTTGCTNYYQAFKNVEEILKGYEKQEDREMIVLFLTDGYPNEETPNEIGEYQYLKSEYPYITINGIQYEMGEDVLDPIKRVSDNQFIADMNNLNNVLFEASVVPTEYSNITITDYINDEYFNIESIDEVYTNIGEAKLEYEKGLPKVIWSINNIKSGKSAKMTINVTFKGNTNEIDLYPTNQKEIIKTSLPNNPDEEVVSKETPILSGSYLVTYEGNAPEGCSVENVPAQEKHLVFDKVDISNQEPTCEGYQFKGWEIITKDVKKVNQDTFIMPGEDVVIRATWSSLTLAKSMNGKIAEKVQSVMKKRNGSNSTEAFWKYNRSITSIVFEDWIHVPSTIDSDKKWDVSAEGNGSVMAYIEPDSEGSSTYKLHIQGYGKIIANPDSSYLFQNFTQLTIMEGLEYFDTAKVVNMKWIFSGCSKLVGLDVSSFDTFHVTNMNGMFYDCSGLTSLDVSNFDTSNVMDMSNMFYGCSSLTSLDVSHFNTSNVTNMSGMFNVCRSLTDIDISHFNTSKVTNMSIMFHMCNGLISLDLSYFDTSNVTNMSGMFGECSKLSYLDLGHFNTSSVTDMRAMFSACSSLTSLDVSNFNTSKVTDMSNMFSECKNLASLDVSHFDTSNVKNISNMFRECSSLIDLDLNNFDTKKIFDMSQLFYKCYKLVNLNIRNFDTSSVTNMHRMFGDCISLANLDVSHFDTSKVTSMSYMFDRCINLTSLDLSNFNTSSVTGMYWMFHDCSSLANLDLSNFNILNVTDMSGMFTSVKNNCLILVKDEDTKAWVLARRSDLNNVVIKSS